MNIKLCVIGAGSQLSVIAKAIGERDILSCIRYSPVALKTDSREVIREKTREAIRAFGSAERLCFSCVGIDAEVSIDKVREYLGVCGGGAGTGDRKIG